MTREDKLYSMRMQDLVAVAENLGIKINVKASKSKAVEKILAAEEMNKQNNRDLAKEEKQTKKQAEKILVAEDIKDQDEALKAVSDTLDGQKPVNKSVKAPNSSIKAQNETPKVNTKPEPKKSNLRLSELTYKGRTQSIKAWAAEIGMPWPTLYDRINRNGWPVDLAIETPLGQRRPKVTE